ncbi:DUF2066 domain-containing protein [Kineobactrum sediminis]|uniref:DUF2066 domain-containing protein n=1 Tax=Kineobactrum sediminis TaxID=1905677 RepID=UPI0013904FF2|nr:DUF2066 domain-containing protein [Kineobactrum sediminis]
MISLLLRLTCLVVLLAPPVVATELVRDLYIAEVPVTDRGAAELDKAAAEGLAQVLVKVSGTEGVLALPAVENALPVAREQMLQYSYTRATNADTGEQALAARVEFEPSLVRQLLATAGAPMWTATRPVVLVWVVKDGVNGRHFVNSDTDPELVAELARAFHRRGVPVRLPLFDLEDTASIDPDQAWSLAAGPLRAASSRYGATEILAGRVAMLSSGDLVGDWLQLSGNNRTERGVTRASRREFAQQGAALVAESMASRYALPVQPGANLTMTVSGVNSYADYASIVAWLESLEPIEQASVTSIRADVVSLQLTASAIARQLAPVIELNSRLAPVKAERDASEPLSYRWQN